jgi:UDP-3-O-[3-hydroxymyristoyl] glucosamine N-acyltransferase
MYQLLSERSYSAKDIAKLLDKELYGGDEVRVSKLAPHNSPKEGSIIFIHEKGVKLFQELRTLPGEFLFILPLTFKESVLSSLPSLKAFIFSKTPHHDFIKCVPLFYEQQFAFIPEVSFPYIKGNNVEIGVDTVIYPGVTIYPGVKIGSRCVIHSNVVLRERVILGDEVVIQNGAVIGGDGFGYIPDEKAGLLHVPQLGGVILKSRVEIGANSCIDRGTLSDTVIHEGVKIDNLVQVGHNCEIGAYSIICGNAGLAGTVTLGTQSVIGGGAGVADHVRIGDRVRVAAYSGVTKDLLRSGDYAGFPARPISEWRKTVAKERRSPKTNGN